MGSKIPSQLVMNLDYHPALPAVYYLQEHQIYSITSLSLNNRPLYSPVSIFTSSDEQQSRRFRFSPSHYRII